MFNEKKNAETGLPLKVLAGATFMLAVTVGCSNQPASSGAVSPKEAVRLSGTPAAIEGWPAQKLDLKAWKLTLPVGEQFSPQEVVQPELGQFSHKDFFFLSEQGVVFRANAGGVTTPNSSYPRTELREMSPDGAAHAAWSTTAGRHTLRYSAAITGTPKAKPHVVVGQLLEPKDDVVMIRLERKHLFVEGGGNNLGTLDRDYELGTFFSIILDVSDGWVRVYYNGETEPRVKVERRFEDCYFKIGSYVQSNLARGDRRDAQGEVVVSAMSVEHSN